MGQWLRILTYAGQSASGRGPEASRCHWKGAVGYEDKTDAHWVMVGSTTVEQIDNSKVPIYS